MRPFPGLPAIRRPRRAIAGAAAAALGLLAGLALAPPRPASAAPVVSPESVLSPASATGIAGWTQTGSYLESSLTAGEGVATVSPASGSPHQLYRGVASIPARLLAEGWTHIGDPDSAGGYIIDAYQGASSSGTFEAEGVDYDVATRVLRVEIIQPGVCEVATTVYEYQPS